jgi:hypothetical protein
MHRRIERNAHRFAPDSVTMLTDDLHSHQPACLCCLSAPSVGVMNSGSRLIT